MMNQPKHCKPWTLTAHSDFGAPPTIDDRVRPLGVELDRDR